jgi:hypothetical protein
MTQAQLSSSSPTISLSYIIRRWWPLAGSWLLMGVELPALSAVVARLAYPEIHLAAYGGIVFPLSLIIESPIIMLLAASTALSRDWDSYLKLRRFMTRTGAFLTVLHVLTAFTPLYYVVVEGILGAPSEIVEPARIGLMIMTPWSWSIAYRRFQQGILIRFDHANAVGVGTIVRLTANLTVLTIGYLIHTIPGIVVAASAISAGVVSEAVYAGLRVRPVLRDELRPTSAIEPALTFGTFIHFYIPLVMTSLLTLLSQPIGSAALSRMPLALQSLAAWPVISGLVFMTRSFGIAYNEVVVALLDEQGAVRALRQFATLLAGVLVLVLFAIAATPLAGFWFRQLSGLSPALASMAQQGLWLCLPMPALAVLQSWYQGSIVNSRRTHSITEAVVVYLVSIAALLWAGVLWRRITGLYVGLAAMSISMALQTGWLWWRSRPVMSALQTRDESLAHGLESVDATAR